MKSPCYKCDLTTRQSCCGCPEYFRWKKDVTFQMGEKMEKIRSICNAYDESNSFDYNALFQQALNILENDYKETAKKLLTLVETETEKTVLEDVLKAKNCPVCGKLMVFNYRSDVIDDCICRDCFTKEFWERVLDDKAIIVNGHCYHTADENTSSPFRGFGGTKFKIRFLKDGRTIETTNLWSQGEIPKEYAVPDNAIMDAVW